MKLYECDQCGYSEIRDFEPDMCPVCGNFRWREEELVVEEEEGSFYTSND